MSVDDDILEIEPTWRREIEDMGSKPKFWFRYRDEMWLFKRARENTGEHWAEKVTSEIADLLGLPTHRVLIARYEGRIGCAVRSFLKPGQSLEHRFTTPKIRQKVSVGFVGYLMLDALVGNTDRHHENWGVLQTVAFNLDEKKENISISFRTGLAPTFDHGSSLGRELLDEARRSFLNEPGKLARYIRKGTGGIFRDAEAKKGLAPIALASLVAERYPKLCEPWKRRIADLPDGFAQPLLENIPDSCMTPVAKEFVLAFLSEARTMIASIP